MAVTTVDDGPWRAEGAEKREAVREMFGEIAPTYDLLNSIMSLRLHHRWRRLAVARLELREGDSALDLCCGTGDFMAPLRRAVGRTGSLLGVDFSRPMLDRARRKGPGEVALGDACALPVRAATFDAVTVGWGLRNVPDARSALAEIARVLRPGGRFVSLDMAVPRHRLLRWTSSLVFGKGVPLLGRLFGRGGAYAYLPKSTDRFMGREELAEAMRGAGFLEVAHRDLFHGNICMHWGRKP